MNIKAIARYLPLTATLLVAGCSLAPTTQLPESPAASGWAESEGSDRVSTAATLDWQSFVLDEDLRALIDVALANNRDLRQALLDIAAARAQYGIQRADRLPGLELQGSGNRQRLPGDLSVTGDSQIQESYQAGLGLAAFELDLFGRVRSLSQAALETYLATEDAARSVRISLVAEVIQAYLARDSAGRRYLLTEQTLRSREASQQLIAQRRQAGTATALDYYEALGLTEQARADLERIDREFRQAGNALDLLVGVADVSVYLPKRSSREVLLVEDVGAGTPSDLLVWRPDIRAAEHRLRARSASIGAARAAFFPQISLTGLFGSASADLSNLFESGQRAWSFTPRITLPIFAGGRYRASLDLAEVRRDMAVADYERTIQTAFREVADALVANDTLRREEVSRRALAEASAQALRLAEARYRAGLDDHLRYLESQRRDFANQTALIEVATQRQVALATLFRALGGGWHAEALAEPAQPGTAARESNGSGG